MCPDHLKSHRGRRGLHCGSYLLWISLPGYWQRQLDTLTLHYGEQWHQQVGGLPGYLERGRAIQLNTRRREREKNRLQISSQIIVCCCSFSQSADTLRNRRTTHTHTGECIKTLMLWCDRGVLVFRNSVSILYVTCLTSLLIKWFLKAFIYFMWQHIEVVRRTWSKMDFCGDERGKWRIIE